MVTGMSVFNLFAGKWTKPSDIAIDENQNQVM